jgi:manganese efflux pump family protein
MGSTVALLLLGFLLGLDSFRASLGLGIVHRSGPRRFWIPVSFGLCDGIAPVLGLAAGSAVVSSFAPWTRWLGPLVLGGFGVLTFLAANEYEAKEADADGGWPYFGLPLILSLDNLVAGLGLGAIGAPVVLSAAVIGLISGLMSLAGMSLGSVVGRSLRARAAQVGGATLAVLAPSLAFDIF